jgi:hypothetical protein
MVAFPEMHALWSLQNPLEVIICIVTTVSLGVMGILWKFTRTHADKYTSEQKAWGECKDSDDDNGEQDAEEHSTPDSDVADLPMRAREESTDWDLHLDTSDDALAPIIEEVEGEESDEDDLRVRCVQTDIETETGS